MSDIGERDLLSRLQAVATVTLAVYPIFTALYTAGFFWDINRDALGGFGFSEIIFKSSVIYASMAGLLVAYLFGGAALYAAIPDEENDFSASTMMPARWPTLSRSRKIRHVTLSALMLLLMACSYALDPAPIYIDPFGFAVVLGLIFVVALFARPFISDRRWRASSISYFTVWVIILPFTLGFLDSQVDENSPLVRIKSTVCRVSLVGYQNILARCPMSFVLIPVDHLKGPIIWPSKRHYPTP